MNLRTKHVGIAILAILLFIAGNVQAIQAMLPGDPSPAVGTVLSMLAMLFAYRSRLEVITGVDLDGDGRVGPPTPPVARSPWIVGAIAFAIAVALLGCGAASATAVYLGGEGDACFGGGFVVDLTTGELLEGDIVAGGDGRIYVEVATCNDDDVCHPLGGGSIETWAEADPEHASGAVRACADVPFLGSVCHWLAGGPE